MNQPAEPVDPKKCPLCGNPNSCGQAAGESKCWCSTAVIPQDVLESVPAWARDVVCICPACAMRTAASRQSNP